ncbi:MAG TPA: hypothetical protein DHV85_14480 [Candidatus Accumulibacter sp.]|nr:hypothetical protein [Accumulibacter sp.]
MQEAQIKRAKIVTLPQEEFEAILERAAERGARHALSEVGLDGPEAAGDISEMRSLLDVFDTGASCRRAVPVSTVIVSPGFTAARAAGILRAAARSQRMLPANIAVPRFCSRTHPVLHL